MGILFCVFREVLIELNCGYVVSDPKYSYVWNLHVYTSFLNLIFCIGNYLFRIIF